MARFSDLSEQMKHRDREMVPKALVQAMFALMIATTAIVAFDQITDRPLIGVPADSPVVAETQITLDGTRSTGVAVLDQDGTQIAHSTDDRAGFIDVIWNSTTRERTLQGLPLDAPLRVVRRENGRTAILDDTTGWSIELIGYGQDNVAAFARLID